MDVKPSHNKNTNETPWIAIVGNPNCGKTALFNRLTGLHHKVGNYPGITVEKKSGTIRNTDIILRDLPGTYSLQAKSIDEKIVSDMVQSWRDKKNRPRAVIVVVDATNLVRNIYLALQILDWNIPTVIVLNMMDEARKKHISIDTEELKRITRAWAVIPASAKLGEGIKEIISTIEHIPDHLELPPADPRLVEVERYRETLLPLESFLAERVDKLQHHPRLEALRLLADSGYINYMSNRLNVDEINHILKLLKQTQQEFDKKNIPYQTLEQTARFAYIDLYLSKVFHQEPLERKSLSERADALLTHKVFGPVTLILVLGFIFNAIFSWAQYPMDLIQEGVSWLSNIATTSLPPGTLKDLVVNGVIAGVGSILVFFPQIILLVFFLGILEDTGYMARMAFMMDKLMSKIGLNGRSVLPLLSGFACAIPAIMSARTIDNKRDRIVTILLTPLMSCSARLPVYTLMIAAFIPDQTLLGFLSLQAAVLMGIYFLGMFTAIFVALVFKRTYPSRSKHSMMLELPPYRMPLARSLWWQIYDKSKSFLTTAGSIILTISIVLWFLASYPKVESDPLRPVSAKEKIEHSYAGQLGHLLEPVIKPLGFDWKIGVGLVTSFAAREVMVSTLSTLYNLENDSGKSRSLIQAMREDRHSDGTRVFTPLVALSLMVFFVYAAQCMATFAIIKKETNSWRWPLIMVGYMSTLAYIASFLVFQIGTLAGF